MFGDGASDCVKVDAIRCRSNALVHNSWPLPVASIIDAPKEYDYTLAENQLIFTTVPTFITSTPANLLMTHSKLCLIQDPIGIGTRMHITS